jgi:hypothetical protein
VRAQRRRKLLGFAIYVAIISATVAWFAFLMPSDSLNSEATVPAPDADHDSHYSGKIVVRADGGGCRRLSFDNGTGALQDGGVAACKDTNSATNSTESRMREIRGAFRK